MSRFIGILLLLGTAATSVAGEAPKGAMPAGHVGAMAALLGSEGSAEREQGEAFFRTAPQATVDELMKLLDSPDAGVRLSGVRGLWEMNLDARKSAARLLRVYLEDPNETIRGWALAALEGGGWPTVAEWMPRFLDGFDRRAHDEKCRIIMYLGSLRHHSVQHIPWLVQRARDPQGSPRLRQLAISALGEISFDLPPGHVQVPQIAAVLLELFATDSLRRHALWNLTLTHRTELTSLSKLLQTSNDVDLLGEAISVLANQRDSFKAALPAILAMGYDEKKFKSDQERTEFRSDILWSLRKSQIFSEEAMNFLFFCLNGRDRDLEISAIQTAGALGPRGAAAIPKLIIRARRFAEEDVRVQHYAIEALIKIAPTDPRVHDVLVKGCRDSSWRIRRTTLEVIAEQRVRHDAYGKQAALLLRDPQPEVRILAARVCVQHGQFDPPVISAIREVALKEPSDKSDDQLRRAIAAVIDGLETSEECRTILREILEKHSAEKQQAIMLKLDTFTGRLPPASLETIRRRLDDSQPWVQIVAATVLLRNGSQDDRTIDLLVHGALRYGYADSCSALEGLAAAKSLPASVVSRLRMFADAPTRKQRDLYEKLAAKVAR